MRVEFRFAIGDRVLITEAKIEAWVERMAFGPETGHEYRVVYWHDGSRRSEWLYERELEPRGRPPR